MSATVVAWRTLYALRRPGRFASREGGMLSIAPERVCFLIVKAREFDAKMEPEIPDPGDNPTDDADREILFDYPDDPTVEEIRGFLESLNEDEADGTAGARLGGARGLRRRRVGRGGRRSPGEPGRAQARRLSQHPAPRRLPGRRTERARIFLRGRGHRPPVAARVAASRNRHVARVTRRGPCRRGRGRDRPPSAGPLRCTSRGRPDCAA